MPISTHNCVVMDKETKDVIKMVVVIVVGLIVMGNMEQCDYEDDQRIKQERQERANNSK